jgi:hypothetical protein
MLAAAPTTGCWCPCGTWCGGAEAEERRPSWMWWRDEAEEASSTSSLEERGQAAVQPALPAPEGFPLLHLLQVIIMEVPNVCCEI